jgi:hypothetical protein
VGLECFRVIALKIKKRTFETSTKKLLKIPVLEQLAQSGQPDRQLLALVNLLILINVHLYNPDGEYTKIHRYNPDGNICP